MAKGTGGHAGTANKDGKPYLSHVPNEAMRTHHNGKHSDHPTNNMSLSNLHRMSGGMGDNDGDEGSGC